MAKSAGQLTVEEYRQNLAAEAAQSTRQTLLRLLADEQAKGKAPRWRRLSNRLKQLSLKNQIGGSGAKQR